MKLNDESISKIATACVIGLLSWNVMTTHELATQQSVIMYKLEQLSDDKEENIRRFVEADLKYKGLEERIKNLENR